MKIGIFGGSFNPPHKMHKLVALELLKTGTLDTIIYVPTGNYYEKTGLVDMNYRLSMLNKMFKDNEKIIISDISKDRKYEYTYQVLDYFKALYPNDKIYFICGSDNLNEFKSWKKYNYIFANYKVLIINREGFAKDELLKSFAKYKNSIIFADIPCQNVSSTYIRKAIKDKNYQEAQSLLDKEVLKYILENNLYEGD